MPIKLQDESEFSSIKIAKGVYASLVTIVKFIDLSNHPSIKRDTPNVSKSGKPYQLCLEVEYERNDGSKWSSKFWGNWNIDEATGRIRGWNSNYNGVQRFFTTFYGSKEEVGKRINDDSSMGELLFNSCIGRKYYRISYIVGQKDDNPAKGSWWDWDKVFLEDTPIEEMQTAWAIASIDLKEYKPDAVDKIQETKDERSGDTSFPHGANDPRNETTNPPDEDFVL